MQPAPTGVEVGVVRGVGAFDALTAEWDELAERIDAVPFLRRGWMRCWWDAFGAGDPEIFVARRDDELVGVLPLGVHRARRAAMANVHTPIFDALAVDVAVAKALWSHAFTQPGRLLDVMAIRDAPHGHRTLAEGARAVGRRPWVRNMFDVPVVDLTATDWDAYSSARGKSLRKTVRRHRRRLAEDASLQVEQHTSTPVDEVLAEAFRIEASGWKGDAGTAISSHVATRRFYTDLAHWLADRGWLRVFVLRHGDRAIAFEFVVDHGGVWYPLKAGYDDSYAPHAPGVLLQWDVLEAAFAAGVARYDYCGEARPYTERWATGSETARRVTVFDPVRGLLDRAALQVARPVVKRVRDRLRD